MVTSAATHPFSLASRVALVTGGAQGLGLAIAAGLADAGAHVLVCARHPQRVNDAVAQLQARGGSAEALVLEMGSEPVWIAESDRARYHAALSHGSNHLVTLVAQAMQVLRGAGVEAPDRVLAPLLSAALDGALRAGDAAITGPVSRGDAGTVSAHVRELAQETPDVLPTYVALARATAVRALASGRLSAQAAESLLDVLARTKEPP